MTLQPPPPPPPPPVRPLTLWQRWRTSVLLACAAVVVLIGYVVLNSGSGTGNRPSPAAGGWRWEQGLCDDGGWQGRFYNLSDDDLSGRLWAVAYVGDREVARDYEVTYPPLAAGDSEGVDFVWFIEGDAKPTRCIIDGFDKTS